ncbi:mitochondrial ATP synthase subunit G protein [Actinidia rufa]|uniref:Mitochondrial ATP synthase subunit G protein n=1 Tax=Actinidia rufa TaxID=165716 RepID=A0A7J0DXT0_9ERIC|nr:mitochondrial ATP synthase subunit G protein [Actinidia rufa]
MDSSLYLQNHSDFHSSYLLSPSSIPGRYELFWKELDYVKNLWKNRPDLKVEDAGITALFGLECFAWYCAGEIVGRGFTFTGYYP